ncbi:hypothetical protein O1611_g817 [Lasiodiplodia mahajangana]|uniref:Uncharacterized protein n=1 Tax=Lasiodiplodia mahajangana TaxID=1108764 RepID=A0ACC2JZF4_9PEZI|nr:hypothetical protein O1611_g817 [Lasiodiplodia mahajangana]
MTQPLDREPASSLDLTEDDEKAKWFSEVLSALDENQLPVLGQDVFRRIHPQIAPMDTEPAVGEPIYGSFHVLFPLTFHTGLCWLVKIPANGTANKWDDISASSLVAEAKTMQLLKRETTIPLPDVFDFSSTTQNALRCPYILLSYISGVPLYNVWFGNRLSGDEPKVNRARRTRALEGIASAMIQLGNFSFRTSGSPIFASDGSPLGTGPARRIDQIAMLDRWFVHKDPADDPIYVGHTASSDPKDYYTFMMDQHPEKYPYPKGLAALSRQLIGWIPEPSGTERFVLSHPDFEFQNFIVSEDGSLRGIIDWDGVAAVPRTIGNARYPGWLTRDWNPAMYGYYEIMEQGIAPAGVWEDSPACLADYRQVYKGAIAKCQGDGNSADLCRVSLITDKVSITADDPRCRGEILSKVTQNIWDRAGQGSEFDFKELVDMFLDNNVDVSVMNALQTGFNALLTEEGL